MIVTTLAQVCDATGGIAAGVTDDVRVHGVSTDSRAIADGDLFVAIVGERHDGHDHAAAAVAAGAALVLASRPLPGLPTVVVPDTVAALGRLAGATLARLRAGRALDVVAVTGSVGKTGTKDLLAQVLGELGPTVAPTGSFNNDIGLPTTVLRCDERTRYLVVEMGARAAGDIRRLTAIAPPQVGVELCVGTAHVGEFGSRAAIAAAKAELVEALPAEGTAVLNADDPLVMAMSARTRAQVVTFGRRAPAQVRASDVTFDPMARASFRLHVGDRSAPVRLALHGEPAIEHALAAAAAVTALGGADVDRLAAALSRAVPRSASRMHVTTTATGVVVVDDAYNASPESVAAALRALAAIAAGSGGRAVAVLGEMRELGPDSEPAHRDVGRLAADLGIERLVAVGEAGAHIVRGARGTGAHAAREEWAVSVPDADTALRLLREELRAGDVVLVKASRAIGLDRVAADLRDPQRDAS